MTTTADRGIPVSGAGVRRITVVAPHTRIDVAVPAQVTFAELLPQLVGFAGLHQDEAGSAGWLLARLGAAPLDPSATVTSAGLLDGEMLQLLPRSAQLPPAVFDDVVDAIADNAAQLAGAWRTTDTLRAGVLVGTVAAAATLATAVAAGPPWTLSAVALAGAAVLSLIVGALFGRVAQPATVLAGAAICAVAITGAALAAALAVASDTSVTTFGAPELLAAAAASALFAGVAAALVPAFARAFTTTAVVSVIALLGALGALFFAAAMVAAMVTALALGVSFLLPSLALRLGRLTPAPVPADMDSFRAGEGPVYDRDVTERAERTERHLDALIAAQTALLVGVAVPLATADDVAGVVLTMLIGIALVLRSRLPHGRNQRRTLLGAGLLVFGFAIVVTGLRTDWRPPIAFAAVGLVVAAVAFTYAVRAPRQQQSPSFSRVLDVIEFLALAAVLPVVGAVLNLYGWVRGLAG